MSYGKEMAWIACFVASEHLNKYGKETVRDMIEKTSCDTVIDFFEMSEQIDYCNEIEEEMIE